MTEGNNRSEMETPKGQMAPEVSAQRNQGEQKSQPHPAPMAPPSLEDRDNRQTVDKFESTREAFAHKGEQPRTGKEPKTSWTREDARLTDAIFGGESEEQILAHNKRIREANEEEQRKTEKLRQEAMKAYEDYQSRLSPQEREARAQAREQRRIRATEKHEGKVVATREEVDVRLASANLPLLTDAEWERVMKDDAWREVQKRGTETSHEMYLERKAEEKAEYRRREAMTPDEREREHQKVLAGMPRRNHIKDFATMTSEEFAEYQKRKEASKDLPALLVQEMKRRGMLPPNLDHIWLNLPSGWAEYREGAAQNADKKSSHTVTFGTPTQEQWDAYYPDLQAKLKAWQRDRNAKAHAEDPRYDPVTGDLLMPDEHSLSLTSEYLITGKTRPRRFIPPGSPHVNAYKPLQLHEEDRHPESEYHERLIKRLIKAGWTEVAPVGSDWQFFAFCEQLKIMSPGEIVKDWLELQREIQTEIPVDRAEQPKKDWAEELRDMYEAIIRALINEQIEEDERKAEAAKAR